MAKLLIHERMVLEAAREGKKTIPVPPGSVITELAREQALKHGIAFLEESVPVQVEKGVTGSPAVAGVTLAIGSDHGGFGLKEALKPLLEQSGYTLVDVGTTSAEACDYPDFAYAVARLVGSGQAQFGIMIDAIGNASAIVANKVPGIRAACCTDEFSARSSREHNNANVLTLGGRVLGIELAKAIVKVWLETSFGGGRHLKRIEKISDVEEAVFRSKSKN